MHEIDHTVGKYVEHGLIEHLPGKGYVITSRGLAAVGIKLW